MCARLWQTELMSARLRHWIEELEDMAETTADELNDAEAPLRSVIGGKGQAPEDTFEWETARLIERLGTALEKIASGAKEADKIASTALDTADFAKTLNRR